MVILTLNPYFHLTLNSYLPLTLPHVQVIARLKLDADAVELLKIVTATIVSPTNPLDLSAWEISLMTRARLPVGLRLELGLG